MIIVDTSGLVAAMFEDQRHHEECARILREDEGPIILSPFVFAEADYLVSKYGGIEAELAFLEEVERGAYLLVAYETHLIPDTRR
ncbi:MAG TPA: PIN domain-containing protein, partial [Thermoanaerobaculia bacterium]|nr:PIN domain-containing protein [Thermoanaerobaculia bacterium]